MITLPAATILAVVCAGPLYGVNCILAIFCAYGLARNGGLKGSNWPLGIVVFLLWSLCTGNFVSVCREVLRGFVDPPALPQDYTAAWPPALQHGISPTNAYFQDQSTPEHATGIGLTVFTSSVTDCFMTWRVYMVYNRRILLAVPFLLLNIITLVFSALLVEELTKVGYNVPVFYTNPILHIALTMWSTSVVTQTSGTLLIMYRELSTPKYVPSTKMPRYCTLPAIACAIIDSGAAFTLCIIFTLGFYTSGRFEGATLSYILGQIAALVPLTIILREWRKTVSLTRLQHGPLLPRSALIRESFELQRRDTHTGLDTDHSQEAQGVNVCVIKSTHADSHSITARDEDAKHARLGSFPEI